MPLRLNGSTSGYTEIDAPASAGNNTLVLPTGNGSAGNVLTTNGSGVLSWQDATSSLYYRLDAARTLVTTGGLAQSIFGVGVTLAASTVYLIDGLYVVNRTSGTTSHTIGLGFGGTATVNNILHSGVGAVTGVGIPGTSTAQSYASNQLANTTATAAITSASCLSYRITGSVSVNAGGTLIPQLTLSTAPGGVPSVIAGSYIMFTPVGSAGSDSSRGTWS